MITTALRILLVDGSKADVDQINNHVHRIVVNPKIKSVDNIDDCQRELERFIPDVVISEYNLPTCTGIDVLELTRRVDESIPFIFLTGALEDEEMASDTILGKAFGFILKKNMPVLHEHLRPFLKKVVFNMVEQDDIREKIRKNKIVVNQIYHYLDAIRADDSEQRVNINKIRESIDEIKNRDEIAE